MEHKKNSLINLNNVSVTFKSSTGEQIKAIENIDFNVLSSEFLSVIGPSGCGKSTILNVIAGIISPTSGNCYINSGDKEIQIGYVFQTDHLLPWRTVYENIAIGLEIRNMLDDEKDSIVNNILEMMKLTDFKSHYIGELSGGMRKRVAIGRVLAIKPNILLMDEPLSSLDAITRENLQQDLLNIKMQNNITIIYVTHDIQEAIFLSDKIVLISDKPGNVKKTYDICFQRPRILSELRFTPAFVELEKEIYFDLYEQMNLKREINDEN